jgi:K+-transporting ATPase ATPase C chain
MQSVLSSLRLVIATMTVCVAAYAALILAAAQAFTRDTANGSLITRSDGTVVGSRLIAQKFERPEYFWPRPSAVDYNAAGAGGSNKSPTSPDLTERAREIVARYSATAANPLPAELAAASGGGLDPHLTLAGALYQAPRVAQARGLTQSQVETIISEHAFAPGGFLTPEKVVNVLELNIALDASVPRAGSGEP